MNHATNESGEDIVDERRKLCLENGSGEFWVVDEDYREAGVDAQWPNRHLPLRRRS